MEQQLKWREETNDYTLITRNEDGSILVEPLSIEEAIEWVSRNKY